MKKTLNELKDTLKIQNTVFDVAYVLKRVCKLKHDVALTDDQWIATLGFIDDNYQYPTATAMLARLKRRASIK